MVNSKNTIIFQGSRGGPTFSGGGGGGGPTFSRGGGGGWGSNCLFPIETHITCDFPGGSGPPVPPLDPHLNCIKKKMVNFTIFQKKRLDMAPDGLIDGCADRWMDGRVTLMLIS